jgi:mono/diheme cytochrome c family protein
MKTIGISFGLALGLLLLAQSFAVQGERVPSAWVPSTPSAGGQPKGYVEYEKFCSQCHGKGVGKPGTLALAAKYEGKRPALLADRTDLTAEIIKAFVRNGVSVMPLFRKTEISDQELDAIASYLTRNNKR